MQEIMLLIVHLLDCICNLKFSELKFYISKINLHIYF